ncbi:MAG: hypothetical protein ACJ76H_16050 [Bacteriovoracaceae bacterium]
MIWIVFFSAIISSFALAQNDPRIDALTKRIEELEKNQEEFLLEQSRENNQVNSFLKDQLTLGGFFESAFTAIDGPDTRFQAMHTGSTLGINLAADFSERLRFVNQTLTFLTYPLVNPHNDPRLAPAVPSTRQFGAPAFGAVVTAGYIEAVLNANTVLQTGVGYVPFGYAAQQRELVLFIRRAGPQLLRTNNLFNPLWEGVHLAGQLRNIRGGYNLYTTNSIDPKANVTGVGGRAWIKAADDTLLMGVSSQVMKYAGHTSEIVGGDVRFENSHMIITSEYVVHMTGEGNDPWTAYFEPAVKLKDGEFLVFGFADYLRNALNKTVALPDPYTNFEYGGGLNWLPTSNTRFRATVGIENYLNKGSTLQGQNRDFWYFDLSAGVAF